MTSSPRSLDLDVLEQHILGRREVLQLLAFHCGAPTDPVPPLFITGKAGVGKTFLIEKFFAHLSLVHKSLVYWCDVKMHGSRSSLALQLLDVPARHSDDNDWRPATSSVRHISLSTRVAAANDDATSAQIPAFLQRVRAAIRGSSEAAVPLDNDIMDVEPADAEPMAEVRVASTSQRDDARLLNVPTTYLLFDNACHLRGFDDLYFMDNLLRARELLDGLNVTPVLVSRVPWELYPTICKSYGSVELIKLPSLPDTAVHKLLVRAALSRIEQIDAEDTERVERLAAFFGSSFATVTRDLHSLTHAFLRITRQLIYINDSFFEQDQFQIGLARKFIVKELNVQSASSVRLVQPGDDDDDDVDVHVPAADADTSFLTMPSSSKLLLLASFFASNIEEKYDNTLFSTDKSARKKAGLTLQPRPSPFSFNRLKNIIEMMCNSSDRKSNLAELLSETRVAHRIASLIQAGLLVPANANSKTSRFRCITPKPLILEVAKSLDKEVNDLTFKSTASKAFHQENQLGYHSYLEALFDLDAQEKRML